MDRDEIIRRIVEADKDAQAAPSASRQKLDGLDEELKLEREAMRKAFYARAERRIDKVRETENEYADMQITRIDQELKRKIEDFDREAEQKRERWADYLFHTATALPDDAK